MKKILYTLVAVAGLFGAVSCSDMLESESQGQLYDPSLSEKTDSVSYAYGILQAMQQLADQYYFQNELRGDLVKATGYASTDIRKMANFEADATNKYDSVYLYYKVINNCNYYLKNRKTDLRTGNDYVVINEYIAVAAIRAWTYLQLVRNYGSVPYITEPVTSVSQINAQREPSSRETILASEAEYLENLKSNWDSKYWAVPNFGKKSELQIGGNGSFAKAIMVNKCFLPINVVLGDLYLENAQYEKAAKSYYDYLYYNNVASTLNLDYCNSLTSYETDMEYPSDWDESSSDNPKSTAWNNIFKQSSAPGDVITYIPMATSVLNGQVTSVPEAFGCLYYSYQGYIYSYYTDLDYIQTQEIQVVPTTEFREFYTSRPYYYHTYTTNLIPQGEVNSVNLGDSRFNFVTHSRLGDNPDMVYIPKLANGNFYLYRSSTVFLHLAEALNRMGYPDAAFAILKVGMNTELLGYSEDLYDPTSALGKEFFFMSQRTLKMLSTTLNFIGTDGLFSSNEFITSNVGIHAHGAGLVRDYKNRPLISKYNYFTELSNKFQQLDKTFSLGFSENYEFTREDSINAMEDILCDEYALELAFEGCRFGDLQRMARHKNESGLYGGGFGDAWLADKLKGKGKVITTQNCYLPFK